MSYSWLQLLSPISNKRAYELANSSSYLSIPFPAATGNKCLEYREQSTRKVFLPLIYLFHVTRTCMPLSGPPRFLFFKLKSAGLFNLFLPTGYSYLLIIFAAFLWSSSRGEQNGTQQSKCGWIMGWNTGIMMFLQSAFYSFSNTLYLLFAFPITVDPDIFRELLIVTQYISAEQQQLSQSSLFCTYTQGCFF